MAVAILLKNGVVVVHEADDSSKAVKADVLLQDDKIAQIAAEITPPADTLIVDCTDKIIAPGFIDTHRHMYNTALRGTHGDDLLIDYLLKGKANAEVLAVLYADDLGPGILQGGTFNPKEIFWGQLAGCLESISAGTTTVVDHSHLNYGEDHPKAAIAATAASGIRSIYGYCFTVRVDSWSPFAFNPSFIAPFAMDALKRLASAGPLGNGRISLGVAFDGWFLPQDMLKGLVDEIKGLGIRHITSHNTASPPGRPTNIEAMHSCGALSPELTVVLSHANFISPEDVELVKANGAYLSSTPSIELQTGLGTPVCFDAERNTQSCSSLGVDCHNVALASVVGEMRSALTHARGTYNAKFHAAGKVPAKMNNTVQEAYALGTIQGARAVGLEKEIGSLAVGKKADIIVFDALSPSMICGAQRDPITAIVMHSTPGDIVMTFVDGVLRKDGGKILPVEITEEDKKVGEIDASSLSWADVGKYLLATQTAVLAKVEKLDLESARKPACSAFGMDPSIITAKI